MNTGDSELDGSRWGCHHRAAAEPCFSGSFFGVGVIRARGIIDMMGFLSVVIPNFTLYNGEAALNGRRYANGIQYPNDVELWTEEES